MDAEKKEKEQKKKKVPFYKKWWFWVIIGVVVLLAIGGIVVGNSETEQLPPETHYIGESVTIGSSSLVVVNVQDKKYVSYVEYSTNWEKYPSGISDFETASTENNFIVVELKITNNASTKQTYEAEDFLLYKGDTSYAYASKASAYANDKKYYANKVADPTLSTTLYVVFEVPSTHEQDTYILKPKEYKHISIVLGDKPEDDAEAEE